MTNSKVTFTQTGSLCYTLAGNQMSPIDLTSIYKQYEGKWVALSDDYKSVFGAGNTAKEAAGMAESAGHKDFTLLYVEPSDVLYCGCS